MTNTKLQLLLKNEGYPSYMIGDTITKLEMLQPIVAKQFDSWVDSGMFPDLSIEGISFAKLVKERGMNPIGAFLALDWLAREPETAKTSLSKKLK